MNLKESPEINIHNLPSVVFETIISFLSTDTNSIRYLSQSSKPFYNLLAPSRFSKITLKDAKYRRLTKLLSYSLFSKNFYTHVREIELVITIESYSDYILNLDNVVTLLVWLCDDTEFSFGGNFTRYANRIVAAYPGLKKLRLWSVGVCKQTDDDLAMMARNLPCTEFLELSFSEFFPDSPTRFENFAKALSLLKSLHTFVISLELYSEQWEQGVQNLIEIDRVLDGLQHSPNLSHLKISEFVISSPQSSS
ncbi:hypothetical protein HK098_006422, partial [Nowakowskiella sp. JEL0407]